MIRTYKFRLYPTNVQEQLLNDTVETCRRLYNESLDERTKSYEVGLYEQKRGLTERRKKNKYLKQVHSQVLQDVLLRLDKAYQAFFKKLVKYPAFKRRGKYNSFTYPQYRGFRFQDNRLVLSHIGNIIIKIHRIPVGSLKTCTVIKDVDRWYVCITSDDHISKGTKSPQNSKAVGVDLGLLSFMTLSSGETIENPKHLSKSIQRIKLLQRNLARKKKGSENRAKAKKALAKAWRKVRRQRDDYVHKVSTKLASNYNTIVFEKLAINNMVKNHSLASAIMDATWGKLRQMTAYKVERRGGQVILVNPSGTSQKCSRCGVVKENKLDLDERTFECHSCGLVIDRDHNAALNILKLGLEQTHAEAEPLLVRRTSKFSQGSKKPQ